jgi:hypothetical protein
MGVGDVERWGNKMWRTLYVTYMSLTFILYARLLESFKWRVCIFSFARTKGTGTKILKTLLGFSTEVTKTWIAGWFSYPCKLKDWFSNNYKTLPIHFVLVIVLSPLFLFYFILFYHFCICFHVYTLFGSPPPTPSPGRTYSTLIFFRFCRWKKYKR